ncbi:MAG: hypothetical protein IJS54_06355 [Desulfovibrio sp.]|nr:hypothetical protein [Desulfovibrio sp.]
MDAYADCATYLPSYASDTSGVCSALYELGGLTVVHDASGCNSTYSTFDEPRWFKQESAIVISGLTEMDAIMGDDQKLIDNCIEAAHIYSPNFLALCSSPMPFVIGTDLPAIGAELEERLGIPVLVIPTNGIHSYIAGCGLAWEALLARFCQRLPKSPKPSINILGASPLDIENNTLSHLCAWIRSIGFQLGACLALHTSLEDISSLPKAHANLVLSSSALPAARFLTHLCDQPSVLGLPIGSFAPILKERLWEAVTTKQSFGLTHTGSEAPLVIAGEAIFCASLATALPLPSVLYSPLECPPTLLLGKDSGGVEDESKIQSMMATASVLMGDPFYQVLAPEKRLLAIPHRAFSGRVFAKDMWNILDPQAFQTRILNPLREEIAC